MRLGFLGPASADTPLGGIARRAREDLGAERVVYLGVDGALDEVVRSWAEALVGGDPTDAAMWARAAEVCAQGDARAIDGFLSAERARRALRCYESLLDESTRGVEMLGSAVAVMVYDKATLTEEDMLPARVLIFGKSRAPLIRQVGQRWFLSPGGHAEGGTLLLEDEDDGLSVRIFDATGIERRSERLSLARATKMKVGGARV